MSGPDYARRSPPAGQATRSSSPNSTGWLDLSVAGVADAQSQSVAAQPASGGGAASLVATLTPVGGFAGFTTLASSSSIVVAGGHVTDVFAKSSAGWQNSGPVASLVDPVVSDGPNVLFGGPTGLSVSENTVVEAMDKSTAIPVPGVEDVFVKPAGGWSGSIAPAATLAAPKSGEAVTGAVISGSVVAGDVISDTFAPRRLDGVAVYAKPSAGWSGPLKPNARLALPRGASPGYGVAISSGTIFVSTETKQVDHGSLERVYVFNEPARGWSGTIKPSARLRTSGSVGVSISVSGAAVVVGGEIFTKPRHGWAGVVAPVARVVAPRTGGQQRPVLQASSPTTVATASVGRIPPGGCVSLCTATVATVSKSTDGWSGTLQARTIVHTSTGTSLLPIAVTGQHLYVTGGGSIQVFQLAGATSVQ